MPAMREIVVRPLGLINRPNKYGVFPAGAMSRAKNVAFWWPGVVSARPGISAFRNNVTSTIRALIPVSTDPTAIALASSPQYITASSTTAITKPPEIPTATTWSFAAAKTWWARMRGRLFTTSGQGAVAFDEAISYTAPRMAGLPAAFLYNISSSSTDAQSQPSGYVRRYRFCIRRIMSDGYEIVSEVSSALQHTNTSGSTVDLSLSVYWQENHGAVSGDQLEMYRTLDTPAGSDPGETYYLVRSHILVNANFTGGTGVGAGGLSITDRSRDDSIDGSQGFLYTNDEGIENTNTPPPPCDDVAAFAGHMFYLSPTVTATYSFAVTGKHGVLTTSADRSYGIGRREITGDTHTTTTVDNISATHILGLAVGQRITGDGIPNNTRISAVGASSVTLSQAATATAAGVTIQCTDVIEYGAGASDFVTMANTTSGGGDTFYPESDLSTGTRSPLIQWVRVTPLESENGASSTLVDGPSFVLRALRPACGTFTLRATNGANYAPKLPDISATAVSAKTDPMTNRLHYSKNQKPEAVPVGNYLPVGAGTAYRILPTRDALWVFCSDGLYRLSGTEPPWRVDPVDPDCIMAVSTTGGGDISRASVCVYRSDVYCVSFTRGLLRIDAGGNVSEMSRNTLGEMGLAYASFTEFWLAADNLSGDIFIVGASDSKDCLVYNVNTEAFATFDPDNEDMNVPVSLIGSTGGIMWSNSDGAGWDVKIFDGSADFSSSQLGNAEVRFQPLTGDGDPFSLKEWGEVEYLFEGFAAAATLVPSFDGTNYTARAVPTSSIESRARISVPRNAPALAPRITPGFTFTAGATTQSWSLRAMAMRWRYAGKEGSPR